MLTMYVDLYFWLWGQIPEEVQKFLHPKIFKNLRWTFLKCQKKYWTEFQSKNWFTCFNDKKYLDICNFRLILANFDRFWMKNRRNFSNAEISAPKIFLKKHIRSNNCIYNFGRNRPTRPIFSEVQSQKCRFWVKMMQI